MSEESTTVASIAGAIVEAVRERLGRSLTQQPLVQSSPSNSASVSNETPEPARVGVGTSASLYHRVSTVGSSRREFPDHGNTHAEESSARKRYATPTLFLSKRSRRQEPQPKRASYVRDIFCLPPECQGRSGTVVIPRGARRSALANEEVGLMGKIEFYSDWSPNRMRREVCGVFSKAFGLTSEEIAEGKLFPFDYLQRTGAGSRTLCLPSVAQSFEWNGKQVASLAKSGSVIYILARKEISSLQVAESADPSSFLDDPPSSPFPAFNLAEKSPQQSDDDVVVVDDNSDSDNSTHPGSSQSFWSQPLSEQPRRQSQASLAQRSPSQSPQLESPVSPLLTSRSSLPQPPPSQSSSSQLPPLQLSSSRPSPSQLSSSLPLSSSSQPTSSHLSSQPLQTPTSQSTPSQFTPERSPSPCALERLLNMFVGKLSPKQVMAVYRSSGNNFDTSVDCMVEGPTLSTIVNMLNNNFRQQPVIKLEVDQDSVWQDIVAQYKSPRMDLTKQLRLTVLNQPAVDTGGIRRQVYNTVYNEFLDNKYIKLFEGSLHCRRPVCTAESRASGLFKLIGTMVAHSISQDGIGFPYLSLACYWYIVAGEERAIEFVTLEDIGADAAAVVSKLRDAQSDNDISVLMAEDATLDILERCGITAAVKVTTKDVIAQDIVTHEAIYKISRLLDQFCDGLKNLHVLNLIRAFPEEFAPLFTFTGEISVGDVLDAVCIRNNTELRPGDEVTLKFLTNYIKGCKQEELKAFLIHITGKVMVTKRSIEVDFMDDSPAITSHTCSSLLVLPRRAFVDSQESFQTFCAAMKAVISSPPLSFNMV